MFAVGAAIEKPVVRHGELTVGHEMSGTLSLDHRVIDGAIAAQYLQTKGDVGYVVTDVDREHPEDLRARLEALPETIRCRILY